MPQPITVASRGRTLGLQARLTLLFFGIALFVSALTTLTLLQVARNQVQDDLQQRLLDLAQVGALSIDGDLHARISIAAGMAAPDYLQVKQSLQRIRDTASDIGEVYSMRADADGGIVFVVDAEDDPTNLAALGEVYDEPGEQLATHFSTLDGPIAENAVYTDQWGSWLSGYAPIRNRAGERVGVLGICWSSYVHREHWASASESGLIDGT